MIDTGADINLIKENSLHENVPIDRKIVFDLSGITKGRTRTIGVTKIRILDADAWFHVVPNDFPIKPDGILGTEFFKNQKATIDYPRACLVVNGVPYYFHNDETVTIPARTRKQIFVRVANPEIRCGYIPKLNAGSQVYLGNAVVSNRDGVAHLYVINSSDEDVELAIPTVKIYPFTEFKNQEIDANNVEEGPISDKTRVDKILRLLRLDHLNTEEKTSVTRLVTNYAERFHLPGEPLGATSMSKHRIFTTDDRPINVKQYRYPQIHKEEIQRQVDEMLEKGVIEASSSPYNSPLWIVPKKDDSKGNKKWRLVIDFRALNEKTIGDAYPLPNIVDILDQLGSAKYFSVFDLASGFHQILMDKTDKHKTAFSTPYGHFEYNRMPFGLKNAPATFQRLMDQVLTGLQGIELFVYLDDIVIYARSLEEHEIKFQRLMKRLEEANLFLQPDKCEFLKKEVAYLGHIITENGVRPDPKKVSAVENFPTPKTRKNIKQFLGLAGYYRRFIENFSKIAKPLSDLTKQSVAFEWKQEQQEAFNKLKHALCSEPILQYPNFDEPFIITTDASGYAIGAILSQGKIGSDLPIAYASRVLNDAETRYSPTERELLALVYAVKHFRPYVYGRKFTLVMDHKPLEWLNSVSDPTSRLMRWRLKLAEYDYQIKYKPGKRNKNADALSRNPIYNFLSKRVYPLHAKRALSSSSEISVEQEHKKQKTSHPSFKRTLESEGSGNPAPHKKNRPGELSPYIDSDSETEEELSPRSKFLKALDDSSDSGTVSYNYETDYDTDDSEICKKGEKRKHESSSSTHVRRRKRKHKRTKKHRKDSPARKIDESRGVSKDAIVDMNEAEGRGPRERPSDGDAACEMPQEASVPDDACASRKRPSESHTTGVPKKRIDDKKLYDENEICEQQEESEDEPMDIAPPSSDSYQAQTNIEVRADVHAPPSRIQTMPKSKIKTDRNLPKLPDDVDAIEVLEENIPLNEQELEAMEIDTDNEMDYEINKGSLKYREPKTPSDDSTDKSHMNRLFSPPSYKAVSKPLQIINKKSEKTKEAIPIKKSLNKKFVNKKSSKKINKKSNLKEKTPPRELPKMKESEVVPVNIIDSRDHIWMRNDNIIHFINTRGDPVDEIGKELIARKICQKPKNFKGILGHVLLSEKGNRKIFGIIVKEELGNQIHEKHVTQGFHELKIWMMRSNILHASISESNSNIGIPWYKIRNIIRLTFLNTDIQITICKGLVCIPDVKDRPRIIRECHESSVGGHKGITKTVARIRNKYYWENMKSQVEKFIQTCSSCQKKKLVRVKTKQPMIITDTPVDAFDKVAMDIVGPLPITDNGNEYILTIQDQLTKYSVAVPLEVANSEEIAKAFTRRFICQFGSPKAILTDQGSNFTSSMMKKFAKYFKIKQYCTSAFHPQSNGSLERSHHVLTEYLKHYISDERDWDNWLEHAMFSYNTSVHEGTKFTPYELVFGKTARLPSEIKIDDAVETYDDYVNELIDKLTDLRKLAVSNLGSAKNRYKHYYDRKLKTQAYKIGEFIYLLKVKKKNKFDDEYVGPYEIMEVLDNNNIKILIAPGRIKTVHIDRTKPARIPDQG